MTLNHRAPSPSPQAKKSRRPGLDEISASMAEMRESELFRSYAELKRHFREGVDYEVRERRGSTNKLCAAWHGGLMERGTDVLADIIAGDRLHYYAFKALIPHAGSGEHPLHITSSRFDEPRLLSLVKESQMVLAVHCCSTAGRVHRIFIGGGASDPVKRELTELLRSNDFNAGPDRIFPGLHYRNPVNRGQQPGIQLELSQTYMDWLLGNPEQLTRLGKLLGGFFDGL